MVMAPDERSCKVGAALLEAGADWAVLTSPDGVCYATGHEVPIEAGPSPFAGGPSTAVVSRAGGTVLLVADVELDAAKRGYAGEVRSYEGFASERFASIDANYADAFGECARDLGVGGIVAVEPASFPASLAGELERLGARRVEIGPSLRRERAIKTGAELAQLRRCAELTAIGHRAVSEAAVPGASELELFASARLAMERAAGSRLPVAGDLVTGVERTARVGGWPIERRLEAGDPVLCDLAPRVCGYWGDSCKTLVVGDASPELRRLWELAKAAFERALETARPGIAARTLDAEVREVVRRAGLDYPHHTGHSIGTSVHEWPRIVPSEEALLEPDMVLMLEPGVYQQGVGGVRLESMVRLVEGGCEVLSPFGHDLEELVGSVADRRLDVSYQ